MRNAALFLALLAMPLQAHAKPAPAGGASASSASYSTATTPIGTLFADPAAKSLIAKQFPELVKSRVVARGTANRMTLRSLKRFRPRDFTDARLAALDAEFAKLPAR